MLKKTLTLLVCFLFITCNFQTNASLANFGFLSYLFRVNNSKACLTYQKTVNSTNTNGTSNSYTCIFDTSKISFECTYTTPITIDNTSTNITTEYYNSTDDFIARTKNFAQSTLRYSQINQDVTTNKFFQYDSNMRLQKIIQSDGSLVTGTDFDSKNRITKGYVTSANGMCNIPIAYSYDDTNLIFSPIIYFSQTNPSSNLLCYLFSTNLQDQKIDTYADKNFFITKRIFTQGSTVTTETYTTVSTDTVCTGNDGTPYSAPIIQKINTTGAAIGETLTLTGANFDTNASGNTIFFKGSVSTVGISSTGNTLTFTIPPGATSGQIKVTNQYGTATSKNTFYVYRYFLYTANNGSNTVSSMELDSSTGSLNNLGSIGIGSSPQAIVAASNGKSLFIANAASTTLNNTSINQVNGTLTSASTATIGNGLKTATIDSTGNLLFVANSTDMTISRLLIDQNTGNFVLLGNTNVGVTNLYSIITHPTLPFVYVSASGNAKVYGYIIDYNTGNLNPISGSPFSVVSNPYGIYIEPNGNFLYTANSAGGSGISRFEINQLNGSLSSESVTNANQMETVVVDPSGKYLYACSLSLNTIYSYSISSTSGLSLLGSTPSNQCRNLLIDPQGKYLYATEDVGASAGKVNVYTIQSSGLISSNSSLALGASNPRGLALAKIQR